MRGVVIESLDFLWPRGALLTVLPVALPIPLLYTSQRQLQTTVM